MEPFWTGVRWGVGRLGRLCCVFVLAATIQSVCANPPLNTGDPNAFFITVASRLLSSELNVNLSCIQIYPTNQYTPAVNRLLQVTANIYDATTTNYYPSIFRPLFWKTNELNGSGVYQTNVYIIGYQYLQEPLTNDGSLALPTDASDPAVPFGLGGVTNNIYGVPWILGVKKGLPNFNALELENCFSIQRMLQFNRNSAAPSSGSFPYGRVYTTNQMYIMAITNYFGMNFWNSYASNYDNSVTIVVQDTLSVALTNDAGLSIANSFFTNAFYETNVWPGVSSSSAFILPLGTNNFITQPLDPMNPSASGPCVYFFGPGVVEPSGQTFSGPCFIPVTLDPSNFLDAGTPPLPHFGLLVTNRLQAYILDTNNCILDYVQLGGMNGSLDVNAAIADNSMGYTTGLWSTNGIGGGSTPYGVVEQYFVSSIGGSVPEEDADGGFWADTSVPGTTDTGPAAEQAFFSAFFSPFDEVPYFDGTAGVISNVSLSMQAPFTPTRRAVQRILYEANDPLVHYMTSDLNDPYASTNSLVMDNPPLAKLWFPNDRYAPWGTIGYSWPAGLYDNNPYNLAYKDPWVFNSDDWNFPTNETLNASWLGQVHRGTPWQTIFLKSTNILALTGIDFIPTGLNTWQLWTGDFNTADAVAMAPPSDWHMASVLASLFATNYASLFSVDDANTNDWEAFLDGMTVETNDLSDKQIKNFPILQLAGLVISSNSPQASLIATAIESARQAQPGGYFTNVGDIFAIPQLSVASPYLNTDATQIKNGLNDAALEAIPSQLLPLLRLDSVGSIIPANGQRLIQFTGDDYHTYAVQFSCDLVHWTTLSTHCPVNGTFAITNNPTVAPQYYRTFLLQ